MIDLDALESLARRVVDLRRKNDHLAEKDTYMRFIAACDPATILELVRELRIRRSQSTQTVIP